MSWGAFNVLFVGILTIVANIGCCHGIDYTVTNGKIGDLNTVIISNDKGDMVEIVTDYGGRVEILKLRSKTTGAMRDVLVGHNGDSSAIVSNQFWKGMLLLPWANRIAYGKYSFFNDSCTLPLNDPPRQNALHGFMKGKKLIVHDMQQDETHGSFIATTHINNENGYPYSLKIDITYQLSMEGFHISVNATNTNGGGKPLPFFMGWHPYFKCTAYKSVVTFDNCTGWTHVEMNANLDPTGITATNISIFDGSGPIGGSQTNPTYYDNEYKALTGPISCHKSFQQVRLYDPPTDQTAVLWYNHAFRYVHVYTGLPSADAVAIEPMSGMADAYNNHDGLTVISDGETWSGQFGVYVE